MSEFVILFHSSHPNKTRGNTIEQYSFAAVKGLTPLLWTPQSINEKRVPRAVCRTVSTLEGYFRLLFCVIPSFSFKHSLFQTNIHINN